MVRYTVKQARNLRGLSQSQVAQILIKKTIDTKCMTCYNPKYERWCQIYDKQC